MPRKIRAFKAELLELGFREARKGKGSHRVWKHPRLTNAIVISFKDGADVPVYLEQQLRKARKQLELE